MSSIANRDSGVRVGPLLAIPELLRENGQHPSDVFALVGLELSLFDDPDNTLPFATGGRLLKLCATRTNCPHFGLLVGERAGSSSLGLVGFLVQHSPDVGTALDNLIQHLHLQDRGAVPTLQVAGKSAVLGYCVLQRGTEGADQICDCAMAIACNMLKQLCGRDWLPSEVQFSHSRPSDVTEYRRIFKAPLRFDAEETAIVFPARWLGRKIESADPLLRRALEKQIETAALGSPRDGGLAGELRRSLRTMLVSGQASVDEVAQRFGVHRRTLNRRLHAQATTFHDLVNEVRYDIARELLERTNTPLGRIAATLDYADASAFTRAFKRWSGTTPGEWRAQRTR